MDGADDRASRFETSNARFEALLKEREEKRKLVEKMMPMTAFLGTCQEMCPEFERYEREVHLDLSPYEMVPGSEVPRFPGDHPRIDHGRAVKKYHRPAAGNEMPLPEDVRPPPVLRRTMNYLVQLMEREEGSLGGFAQLQKFVRDRTRSIRQDATLQQSTLGVGNFDVIRVHEEIARFHILSGHRLCELSKADFDAFQNTEQLRKVLQSLNEFYGDLRRRPELPQVPVAEEGEFRAYYLLTHLEDPDVFRKGFGWDSQVRALPAVQLALSAGAAFHQGDYLAFFGLLRRAPSMLGMIGAGQLYLCLCLLHTHFSSMRWKAARLLSKAYAPKDSIPLSKFADWLAFEDPAELVAFCEATGFVVEADVVRPQRVLLDETILIPRRSNRFIEGLVQGISISQIIQGNPPNGIVNPIPPPISQPVQVKPVPVPIPPVPKVVPPPIIPAQVPLKPVETPSLIKPVQIPSTPQVPKTEQIQAPPVLITQPIPKPSYDFDALASLMYQGLVQSTLPAIINTMATGTLDRYKVIDRSSRWLLESLLHELSRMLVMEGAKEVIEKAQKELLDTLQTGLYEALLMAVTEGELIPKLAEDCLREAVVSEMRRAIKALEPEPVDPLEAAYEAAASQAIERERIITVQKPAVRLVEKSMTSSTSSRSEAKLRAGLKRELEESLRYEEYLQRLLES